MLFQPILLQRLHLQRLISGIFRTGPAAVLDVPSSLLTRGRLTVESPVRYRRHGDAALERGAVREKQEGGEESSVGLRGKQDGAAATEQESIY